MAKLARQPAESFLQRPLQVGVIPIKMRVHLRQHRAVTMAHQLGNGQVIVTLHELPSGKAVTHIIRGFLDPGHL